MDGPQTLAAQQLHAEKYREEGESFRDSQCRVASALKDSEEHYFALKPILLEQRFMFGGRIQAAMGAAKTVTPYNCFVSGKIQDSFTEGHGSIMDRAREAAVTMRMGGGIGYDFSTLRPRGSPIKKLNSHSSGPVSFMEVFDALCRTISSSGHRRGAQMGVLRIDHPDILEFINAKHTIGHLSGFNMSVAVTDEFMRAVENDGSFDLKFDGRVYNTVKARNLWETLMRSTWDYAEPGVLFIDRINEMNNLNYCEEIAASNPCGEQPLPPYGACLLGSFNLAKYIEWEEWSAGGETRQKAIFNYGKFQQDIPHVVRAMDNVIDRATYPLYEQERDAKNKRRMGLGVTGVANAGEAIGLPYGTPEFCTWLDTVLDILSSESYLASSNIARDKGSYPWFNPIKFQESSFFKKLPTTVQCSIIDNGLRNSHLISIAPTGTISQCADNISSGIEPVFQLKQKRIIQGSDGVREEELLDYGYRTWGVEGKTADKVTIDEHINVLLTAQRWCDSAVSKTCNVPRETPWEDFKDIYVKAWKGGAKGCTTFTTGGRREGVIKPVEEEAAACYIDQETGRHECD